MNKAACWVFLAAALASASSLAAADEATAKREATRQQMQGSAFGPQLLSEEEQAGYRARIRAAKTPQEAEAVREQHYQLMKARAREKGVALPDKRPPVGGSIANVFGPQLMTEEERAAYRAKIRRAKTEESFEKIRGERHEEMVVRAKEMGMATPETAPAKAGGGIVAAIFGPTLMSEEEQAKYRARLRAAKSQAERDSLRAEHQRLLQGRARENGVTLP